MKYFGFLLALLPLQFLHADSFTGIDTSTSTPQTGSAILINPNGASLSHWNAARLRWKGPDGWLNWDRMPQMAVYIGHLADQISATPQGGATVHAYGVKVPAASFGQYGDQPLVALSGKPYSIMSEAHKRGVACGMIGSGALTSPGTACFLASVTDPNDEEAIALQVIQSDIEVILSGGEAWMLPEGTQGHHGLGKRTDGLNLIELAKAKGYYVVYDRKALRQVPQGTAKLLGVFAYTHTFNDENGASSDALLPFYQAQAPTLAEMLRAALAVLEVNQRRFLLVADEAGVRRFSELHSPMGTLEALRRSDEAIGEAQVFLAPQPDEVLLLTATSSNASGMNLVGLNEPTGSAPFLSEPDTSGKALPFSITWTEGENLSGGLLLRAQGLNSEWVRGTLDNTDVYRVLYGTLFGEILP